MRPAPVSRIVAAALATLLSFVVFAEPASFAYPAVGNRSILLWFPCASAFAIGLMWNAVRNQGTWIFPGAVVLEAMMGRAAIPLGEIVEVHIDEAMTTLGVQTPTHYVVQSIATAANLGEPEGARARADRLLSDRNLRCVWHAGLADVYAVAATTSPFMWPGACWRHFGALWCGERRLPGLLGGCT